MSRDAFCPFCKTDQPHRYATDEMGCVLWCQTCHCVHGQTTPEAVCGDCHYWHFGQCLHANAMVQDGPAQDCSYRRNRRPLLQAPSDF
ncbi:MAG: hypothetical protein H7Z12_09705 [Rhodospirillaceae bacterium]|nr:hypothetical protein [Rhodospirillales bacterium]